MTTPTPAELIATFTKARTGIYDATLERREREDRLSPAERKMQQLLIDVVLTLDDAIRALREQNKTEQQAKFEAYLKAGA